MPKISVIVPVYKAEQYLGQCVDSILSQTFKDFELILVDDGSPDNSGAICDEYAKKDSRVRVIHQENRGTWIAQERGVMSATAKQLVMVERVMAFSSQMLERVVLHGQKEAFILVASTKKTRFRMKLERCLSRWILKVDPKKTIKLYAYLWENLGDDLMVKILLERYPDCDFFMDDPHTAGNGVLSYHNFWDRDKMLLKYRRINAFINTMTFHRFEDRFVDYLMYLMNKQCRCSVQIGGSLFVPLNNMTLSEQMSRERKKLACSPLFIMGVNMNPNDPKEFIDAFSAYFADCENVSFRDQASYQLFESLSNVQFASDIVYNLTINEQTPCDNSVLISVIDFSKRDELCAYAQAYEEYIVRICKASLDRQMQPILCSFCAAEGDEAAIESIYAKLPLNMKDKVKTYNYSGNMDEMLTFYEKASFIVATRFHAMILAIRYQKPFFAVNYNDKISHTMEDYQMDNFCRVTELSKTTAEDTFRYLQNTVSNSQQVSAAQKHFRAFDNYISDK